LRGSNQEDRLKVLIEIPVYLGYAVFIFEISRVTQSAQQVFGIVSSRKFSCQFGERMHRDIRVFDKCSFDFIDHKVNGKVALAFAAVVPNGNDNLIEERKAAKYNVFMTFCKGIKGTWEESDPFHFMNEEGGWSKDQRNDVPELRQINSQTLSRWVARQNSHFAHT
jgi:hypothetical protein